MKKLITIAILLFLSFTSIGQAQEEIFSDRENIKAKGQAIDENTVKLRWAPANTRAWIDGKKYGYIIEKYTLIIDSIYQDNPVKSLVGAEIKAAPLAEWETHALQSDYAAVIAQAFYGDDFELASSSNIGEIINQANELEQRFATSVFMAEYDYKAAELAGWAYTDDKTQKNEQYLYRIILNRPQKQPGDTAAVFIGYADKRTLPEPVSLDGVWGDKAVMLSWNYELLSDIYHSYHIERKSTDENTFKRITDLPVTPLGENMKSLFYTDSLPDNNAQYIYRIQGITTFDEAGPLSDEITGQGQKKTSCIPNILRGYFPGPDKAHIHWSFDCEDIGRIDRLSVRKSDSPDGFYQTAVDNIPPHVRDIELNQEERAGYVKVFAIAKDSTETSSLPFLLSREDTIPPAVPLGLKVNIDSIAVAHLSWDANVESDLRGYRILRSFNEQEEKSAVISGFVSQNYFTDTLSLALRNDWVYYAITAIDMHYNESAPCFHVAVEKPNRRMPAIPVITNYEISGEGSVTISWITDKKQTDIRYNLNRIKDGDPLSQAVIFGTDAGTNTYTDNPGESGAYTYWIVLIDAKGRMSESPQKPTVFLAAEKETESISGFNHYINRNDGYVELFWKKHPQAVSYRIYKQKEDTPATLWKELNATENRIADEQVSPSTEYQYTIVFINKEGRMSPAKIINVDY